MPEINMPHWKSIHTIVFDFDGVFTDNKVWVDQDGRESVRCDRGDGLAFDMLRQFKERNNWKLTYFILSKEVNHVVQSRASKLKIPCIQGTKNKVEYIRTYLKKKKRQTEGLLYVGNDLNDLFAMRLAGISVAPSDAHPIIKKQATIVLEKKGGEGFIRTLIEVLLRINQMTDDDLATLI